MNQHEALSFGRTKDDLPLVEWQTDYRLGDGRIVDSLGACVSPELADLIDVAVAVYVTDRLKRRRPKHAADDGQHWVRRLPVSISLRCPDRWRKPAVRDLLHRLLTWLTDDVWEIEFLDGGPRLARPADSQSVLFEEPLAQPAHAGLLSGGLDSLLGAAGDIGGDGELLLISTKTLEKLGHHQAALAAGLSRIGPRRVRHLPIPVNLTAAGRARAIDGEEPSQRTRAFVFLALGAAAAITGHCNELRVYENGPGSLNLALNPGQRGAMNTRAMRPETLAMMQELISDVAEMPFQIVNPNMWRTKAEMVAAAEPNLDQLILEARSCDTAFSARRPGNAPCGKCTSCVLRRQALLAADRRDLDNEDVALMPGDSLFADFPGVVDPALRLTLQQVHQLDRSLKSTAPWSELVAVWPDLVSARRSLAVDSELIVDLLRRYSDEWHRISAPATRRLLAV